MYGVHYVTEVVPETYTEIIETVHHHETEHSGGYGGGSYTYVEGKLRPILDENTSQDILLHTNWE